LRFRLREAKPLELGQDRIDPGVLVWGDRCRRLAEARRDVGYAQSTFGFQEDLENASGQWRKLVGAAASLIAHDEFTIPLAPDDRVRGYAAPT
jgi:hypothetical protein